jgi:hypothetical protein
MSVLSAPIVGRLSQSVRSRSSARDTIEAMFRTRRVLEEISETLAGMGGGLEEIRDTLQHRPILDRIDHGVQSNTEGLMHGLDELRNGRGGPGTAPAA